MYRIGNQDMFNFNKTSFIIGVASMLKVVTSLDTIG
jgi:hypothetical protein